MATYGGALQEPRLLVGVGAVGGFAYLSSTIAVVEFGGLSTLNLAVEFALISAWANSELARPQ